MNNLKNALAKVINEMDAAPNCWMESSAPELAAVMAAAKIGIEMAEQQGSVAASLALTATCQRWYSAAHESRLACETAEAGSYLIVSGPPTVVNSEASLISWLMSLVARVNPSADLRAIRRFQQRVEATGFSRCC